MGVVGWSLASTCMRNCSRDWHRPLPAQYLRVDRERRPGTGRATPSTATLPVRQLYAYVLSYLHCGLVAVSLLLGAPGRCVRSPSCLGGLVRGGLALSLSPPRPSLPRPSVPPLRFPVGVPGRLGRVPACLAGVVRAGFGPVLCACACLLLWSSQETAARVHTLYVATVNL